MADSSTTLCSSAQEAVAVLLRGTDSARRHAANEWINMVAASPTASWMVATELCKSPDQDIRLFGLSMLLGKLRRDGAQLSHSDRDALYNACVGQLQGVTDDKIRTRLATVTAAAAVAVGEDTCHQLLGDAVEALARTGEGQGGVVATAVAVLVAVAEEVIMQAHRERGLAESVQEWQDEVFAALTPLIRQQLAAAVSAPQGVAGRAIGATNGLPSATALVACAQSWLQSGITLSELYSNFRGLLEAMLMGLGAADPALVDVCAVTLSEVVAMVDSLPQRSDAVRFCFAGIVAQRARAMPPPAPGCTPYLEDPGYPVRRPLCRVAASVGAAEAILLGRAGGDVVDTTQGAARDALALAEWLVELSGGKDRWRPGGLQTTAMACDVWPRVGAQPRQRRHPAMQGPLFTSLLPALVAGGMLPDGFTSWEDNVGDVEEDDFERFRESSLADALRACFAELSPLAFITNIWALGGLEAQPSGTSLASQGGYPGTSLGGTREAPMTSSGESSRAAGTAVVPGTGARWQCWESIVFALTKVAAGMTDALRRCQPLAWAPGPADPGATPVPPGDGSESARVVAFLCQLFANISCFGPAGDVGRRHPLVSCAASKLVLAYADWLVSFEPAFGAAFVFCVDALGVPAACQEAGLALRELCHSALASGTRLLPLLHQLLASHGAACVHVISGRTQSTAAVTAITNATTVTSSTGHTVRVSETDGDVRRRRRMREAVMEGLVAVAARLPSVAPTSLAVDASFNPSPSKATSLHDTNASAAMNHAATTTNNTTNTSSKMYDRYCSSMSDIVTHGSIPRSAGAGGITGTAIVTAGDQGMLTALLQHGALGECARLLASAAAAAATSAMERGPSATCPATSEAERMALASRLAEELSVVRAAVASALDATNADNNNFFHFEHNPEGDPNVAFATPALVSYANPPGASVPVGSSRADASIIGSGGGDGFTLGPAHPAAVAARQPNLGTLALMEAVWPVLGGATTAFAGDKALVEVVCAVWSACGRAGQAEAAVLVPRAMADCLALASVQPHACCLDCLGDLAECIHRMPALHHHPGVADLLTRLFDLLGSLAEGEARGVDLAAAVGGLAPEGVHDNSGGSGGRAESLFALAAMLEDRFGGVFAPSPAFTSLLLACVVFLASGRIFQLQFVGEAALEFLHIAVTTPAPGSAGRAAVDTFLVASNQGAVITKLLLTWLASKEVASILLEPSFQVIYDLCLLYRAPAHAWLAAVLLGDLANLVAEELLSTTAREQLLAAATMHPMHPKQRFLCMMITFHSVCLGKVKQTELAPYFRRV
eukprot:jgi/Mesvir1/6164/Mv00859-RA.3